jgi:XTP/dITP diphosphohydrolase
MREFRELLAPLEVEVLFPPDVDLELNIKEKGDTYAANALLKARPHAQASGLLTLADDSGLEVDALEGAPGIRSARYTPGSDADRVQTLLAHLDDVPPGERTARFRCVVAIATPEEEVYTAEGVCEGVIGSTPAGEGGFGYDPIFYLPTYGLTMAQLPPEVKNQISHRARAVHGALPILERLT